MSLGPSDIEREEPKSAETIRKVQILGGNIIRSFATRPSHALFYLGIAGLLLGLYFGKTFGWQYYAVTGFLGVIELVLWAERRKSEKEKKV